mgnify:CR=1 FL=1
MGLVASFAGPLVTLDSTATADPEKVALNRIQITMAGLACLIVVSNVVFPRRSHTLLQARTQNSFAALHDAFQHLLVGWSRRRGGGGGGFVFFFLKKKEKEGSHFFFFELFGGFFLAFFYIFCFDCGRMGLAGGGICHNAVTNNRSCWKPSIAFEVVQWVCFGHFIYTRPSSTNTTKNGVATVIRLQEHDGPAPQLASEGLDCTTEANDALLKLDYSVQRMLAYIAEAAQEPKWMCKHPRYEPGQYDRVIILLKRLRRLGRGLNNWFETA